MYRPGQVAADLNISPVQLRKLTEQFARVLSNEATNPDTLENGRKANRSYTDADVAMLNAILELQTQGMSDEALEQHLLNLPTEADSRTMSLMSKRDYDDFLPPHAAAAAIGQALQQISDTQQALLNSQQSQRDLLSVVINDAMALKDENDRLRKRLRTVEEEMARVKESEMNYRLSLEERLNSVEREMDAKKSWWSRLTGK
jgi:DNA-binding transcriptional MerR regulator